MSFMNRFGATVDDVLRLLKNVGVADLEVFDANDDTVAGTSVVEKALDAAAGELHSWMPQSVSNLFDYVNLELVETYSAHGQTTVTLSMAPIKDGSVRIYVYGERPSTPPTGESAVSFSVDNTTGVVTLDEPLEAGYVVYASYKPDADNANFTVSLLAEYTAIGAAANVGGILLRGDTAAFQQIQFYRDRFYGTGDDDGIRGMMNGGQLASSMSRMRFWAPVDGSAMVGVIRKLRA